MEVLNMATSSRSASFRFFHICSQLLRPASRRHESTYRRSRSRLNIKPDASFLPTKTELHDHIIFNPPPSAPSVYHTPTIFLPKEDCRRQLQSSSASSLSQSSKTTNEAASDATLPPPVRKPYEKRYHLTQEHIVEMRALRQADPMRWTGSQLAKKFDCSTVFVRFVTAGLSKEPQERQKQVTEAVKSRWGIKRRVAREDRQIRREKWYRDA